MKGVHLTLDDCKEIQADLEESLSKAEIAMRIGKSPSTISKEIKLHRKFRLASTYGRCAGYFCASDILPPLKASPLKRGLLVQ